MSFTSDSWKKTGGINRTSSHNLVRIPKAIEGSLKIYENTNSSNIIINGTSGVNYLQFPDDTKQYTAAGGSTIDIVDTSANITYYPVFVDSSGLAVTTLNVSESTTPFSINPSTGDLRLSNTLKIDQSTNSVAIGNNAGYNTQGGYSVAIGDGAGYDVQGANSVAIGNNAGNSNQGDNSVAIGYDAGIEDQSGNSVAIGYSTGKFNQGNQSVAIGLFSGYSNQGTNSVAIGSGVGQNNQGEDSIAIGDSAGQLDQSGNSIAIGLLAGYSNQGIFCIAIGDNAGYSNQPDYSVAIGSGATPSAPYEIRLGDASNNVVIPGPCDALTFNATSDIRFKSNVTQLDNSLEKICSIRGVNYNWTNDEKEIKHGGVIAQEILKQIPEAVNTSNPEKLSVDYNAIIGHLIESVKTLKMEIEELKSNK